MLCAYLNFNFFLLSIKLFVKLKSLKYFYANAYVLLKTDTEIVFCYNLFKLIILCLIVLMRKLLFPENMMLSGQYIHI